MKPAARIAFLPHPVRIPGMKKIIFFVLVAALLGLQYPLWFANGGFPGIWQLKKEIEAQKAENAQLRERNQALEAEVEDLKQGLAAIEERARTGLGMVKKGETYYQILDDKRENTAGSDTPSDARRRK
jgi:cell division protein FtsB